MKKENFVALHVHSTYSFLDGYNKPDVLAKRVAEMGQTACAVTDHNTLAAIPVWQEAAKKAGIKPLLGLEGYYTPNREMLCPPCSEEDIAGDTDAARRKKQLEIRKENAKKALFSAGAMSEEDFDKLKATEKTAALKPYMYDTTGHHILYIAKNQQGWNNLVKLQSESARTCTFNGRYHADLPLIRKYHKGLICTCACISSYPAHCILDKNEQGAREYLDAMREIFGDDFYLEIQPLNIKKQHAVNLFYMRYAKETGCKVVATNDSHWTYKEDYDDHDTLLCIGTGKKKYERERLHYSNDFWMKSQEEMNESFWNQCKSMNGEFTSEELEGYSEFWYQAMNTTLEVADKCDGDIKLGSDKPLFSTVNVPHDFTPEAYITMLCWRGLYKYLGAHPECDRTKYENRLIMELDVIISKGYAPYFLAVREYVTWANEHNCPTGPGRGSAAGSLALFCTGITKNIDPIKYGLWFSRFLTKDRTSPPDWEYAA